MMLQLDSKSRSSSSLCSHQSTKALRVTAQLQAQSTARSAASPRSSVKEELAANAPAGLKRAMADSPGFRHVVETHQLIEQRVAERLPGGLTRAPVGAADANGFWSGKSLPGAKPASTCILTYGSEHLHAGVQVFAEYQYAPAGKAPAWRVHTETMLHTPDNILTPGLDVILSFEADDPEAFVFNGQLSAKLNLGCHLDYIDKYYNNPPGQPQPAPPPDTTGGGDTVQMPAAPLSFWQLHQEAVNDEAWSCRHAHGGTIRSRAMAAGAMFYCIKHDRQNESVLDRVRHYALSLTDIWLGHMLYDIATGEGRAAGRGDCIARECALASQVERNAARLDPMTQYLVPVYGKDVVQDIVSTMAGEPPAARRAI